MENLSLPFEKEYKENIKRTMNWNDQQFDKFSKTWLYFYNKENPKTGRKGWHWIRAFKQEDVNKVYRRLMKSNK